MNDPLLERAQRLLEETLLIDSHIDLPYRLSQEALDVGVRTSGGAFDYPRARDGGLDLAFLAIYVPATLQCSGRERAFADGLIDRVLGLVAAHPDKFTLVNDVAGVRQIPQSGKVGFALGLENAAPIDTAGALRHFYERGVRYVTLTHAENNHVCDASYAAEKRWNGLSPFGASLLAEMNRLGMMVDLSHVSDAAFEQVLEQTHVPAIASHSSCRHFTPGWERNLSDALICRLAERGGVVQINFGSAFLREDARRQSAQAAKAAREFERHEGIGSAHPRALAFRQRYWKDHPRIFADVADVADHVEHVIGLVGSDHVGLGSDFDGVGDSLPVGLKDVSGYPNLIRELLSRGRSEAELRKLCSGNLLRVWSAVERAAGIRPSAGG